MFQPMVGFWGTGTSLPRGFFLWSRRGWDPQGAVLSPVVCFWLSLMAVGRTAVSKWASPTNQRWTGTGLCFTSHSSGFSPDILHTLGLGFPPYQQLTPCSHRHDLPASIIGLFTGCCPPTKNNKIFLFCFVFVSSLGYFLPFSFNEVTHICIWNMYLKGMFGIFDLIHLNICIRIRF